VADTTIAAPAHGAFTHDQVEILSTRKDEPDWLRDARRGAYGAFADAPMPTTRLEDWRYTDIGRMLALDALAFAEERGPVAAAASLPDGLRAIVEESGETSARLAQVDASTIYRELSAGLTDRGVIFTSLEAAVRDHPELVRRYYGTAVTARGRQVRGDERCLLVRRDLRLRPEGRPAGGAAAQLPLDDRGGHRRVQPPPGGGRAGGVLHRGGRAGLGGRRQAGALRRRRGDLRRGGGAGHLRGHPALGARGGAPLHRPPGGGARRPDHHALHLARAAT
jgi:hypothetical protein